MDTDTISELKNQLGELGIDAEALEGVETKALVAEQPEAPRQPTEELEQPEVERQPRKSFVQREAEKRGERRRQEIDVLRQSHDELRQSQAKTNELLAKLAEAVLSRQPQVDELEEFAKEANLDPVGLHKLEGIMEKRIASKFEKPKVQQVEDKFPVEWQGFIEEDIADNYPNADRSQVRKARKLMDELAHSNEFHTMPLGDIFDENKGDFDLIFRGNKKSAESGRIGTSEEPEVDILEQVKKVKSPKDARRVEKLLDELVGEDPIELRRGGEPISA